MLMTTGEWIILATGTLFGILILKKLTMADERIEALVVRINTALESNSTALTNIAEDIRRIKDTVIGSGAIDEIVTLLEAVAVKVETQAAALTALDLENEPPAQQ